MEVLPTFVELFDIGIDPFQIYDNMVPNPGQLRSIKGGALSDFTVAQEILSLCAKPGRPVKAVALFHLYNQLVIDHEASPRADNDQCYLLPQRAPKTLRFVHVIDSPRGEAGPGEKPRLYCSANAFIESIMWMIGIEMFALREVLFEDQIRLHFIFPTYQLIHTYYNTS